MKTELACCGGVEGSVTGDSTPYRQTLDRVDTTLGSAEQCCKDNDLDAILGCVVS